MRYFNRVQHIYNRYIRNKREEPRFLILISFLLTFIMARIIVYGINGGELPKVAFSNVYVGDIHVHHLVFGIFLLLIAGFIRIPQFDKSLFRVSSVLYGMGAALTLDEFSLWLRFNPDSYFGPEGRISIDAVVIFTLIVITTSLYRTFWRKVIISTLTYLGFKMR